MPSAPFGLFHPLPSARDLLGEHVCQLLLKNLFSRVIVFSQGVENSLKKAFSRRTSNLEPRNLSWTRPSALLTGCLARREEDAGAAPATTSNAARRTVRSAIGCVALSPIG
jgi:hypothetical protein